MPTDPRTGQPLPYPGEPGYEEAMAANPDVYAQEGALPDEGMMPPDEGMMPPDEGMMPEDGGAPSPDDLAMMEQESQGLQQDVTAQMAPAPEKPFSVMVCPRRRKELGSTASSRGLCSTGCP